MDGGVKADLKGIEGGDDESSKAEPNEIKAAQLSAENHRMVQK